MKIQGEAEVTLNGKLRTDLELEDGSTLSTSSLVDVIPNMTPVGVQAFAYGHEESGYYLPAHVDGVAREVENIVAVVMYEINKGDEDFDFVLNEIRSDVKRQEAAVYKSQYEQMEEELKVLRAENIRLLEEKKAIA